MIGHANGPCVGLDLRSRPPSGAGRVQVETGRRAAAAQIEVEFFRPRDAGADTPLLFLLHGRDRDADRYRDAWIPFALRHRRIVVAPRFAREVFGGSRGYNQGNVLDAQGARQSRRLWSLGVVEDVFDALTKWFRNRAPYYDVYGHSAGAQFVHRLALLLPEARWRRAIAANAGWYTMPDLAVAYPYGLAGVPADPASLRQALRRQLVLLLGEHDTDRLDPNLRQLPAERAQGPNRLERGLHFFSLAAATARRFGGDFGWRLVQVPGVAHDHVAMRPAAEAALTAAGVDAAAAISSLPAAARLSSWWRKPGSGLPP